jgi:hypothetical protein
MHDCTSRSFGSSEASQDKPKKWMDEPTRIIATALGTKGTDSDWGLWQLRLQWMANDLDAA